jgi:PAS domain S-box-containing protein
VKDRNREHGRNNGLYRTIMAQSFDGGCLYDIETGGILEVNERLLQITGYSRDELRSVTLLGIGQTGTEYPEDGRLNSGSAAGTATVQGFCRCRDGSTIDVETKSTLVTYRGSTAVLVVVRDMTDRRRAEEELKLRAAVMQDQAELLEVAEDAIMVRDLDERIIFWNKGAEDRYGWTKSEALGTTAQELLKTEFKRPLAELRAELFAKGCLTEEVIHVTRNGARIIVESRWTARRDGQGNPLAIMEINNDITHRKQAEKILQTAKEQLEVSVAVRTAELRDANERLSLELERKSRIQEMLRKAAERYKNLFDNSPMGIYRTSADGRILMANPSLLRMLGYGSTNTLASVTPDKGLYEPTYLRKRFLNRLRREGRVRGFECSWKRHDGSVIFVRENARTIRSSEESILFCEGTVEDISEQKKAEESIQLYQRELRSLAAELSLAEERERRRIATTLHDNIGQILAMSKIRLGSLAESAASDLDKNILKEIREYLDQAISYTRSLTFELSPPILYALGLEAALEWLTEQTAEQNNIVCEFENDDQPKPVSEEIRIFTFTAVRELLANVVKRAHASRAKVTARTSNRSLVIHVADDGTGFNPSRLKTHDNKGFGLFSIRERLRHLGGQMEVRSAKGRGTRVALEAPLKVGSSG